MTTITTASSMARGSPARIVRPNAAARTPVQRSREAALRASASVSRSTASSCTGTQLMPTTSPKWATWADMAPAKANESAPRALGRLARRRARRKANMPTAAAAQVTIMLSVHAAVPGTMANRSVSGYAAPAFQSASNGAPLQMYGLYSGSCPSRIWRPASTRSGKFCVRSSPGRTECPSSAGTPKTMTGSATRMATAATSPGRRVDARVPGTWNVLVPGADDSSGPIVSTRTTEAERILARSLTGPPGSPQMSSGPSSLDEARRRQGPWAGGGGTNAEDTDRLQEHAPGQVLRARSLQSRGHGHVRDLLRRPSDVGSAGLRRLGSEDAGDTAVHGLGPENGDRLSAACPRRSGDHHHVVRARVPRARRAHRVHHGRFRRKKRVALSHDRCPRRQENESRDGLAARAHGAVL